VRAPNGGIHSLVAIHADVVYGGKYAKNEYRLYEYVKAIDEAI